ncbi:hypothetical protein ACVIJW_004583 [Bradyrhizobium barranii subsp. barranii]
MRTVDFSPLFRSAIGFDRLFDLAEAAQRVGEESYPPTTSNASTRTASRFPSRSPVSSRTRSI